MMKTLQKALLILLCAILLIAAVACNKTPAGSEGGSADGSTSGTAAAPGADAEPAVDWMTLSPIEACAEADKVLDGGRFSTADRFDAVATLNGETILSTVTDTTWIYDGDNCYSHDIEHKDGVLVDDSEYTFIVNGEDYEIFMVDHLYDEMDRMYMTGKTSDMNAMEELAEIMEQLAMGDIRHFDSISESREGNTRIFDCTDLKEEKSSLYEDLFGALGTIIPETARFKVTLVDGKYKTVEISLDMKMTFDPGIIIAGKRNYEFSYKDVSVKAPADWDYDTDVDMELGSMTQS